MNGNLQVVDNETIVKLVTSGDTSGLNGEQRLQYYRARCEAAGLDYRTAPFQFLRLQGKEVLYAKKEATDQLASKHKIKCEIVSQSSDNGMRVVTVRAIAADGRQTDEIGALPIENLRGAELANAFMKCVTKAKRRAILSLSGLGVTDESELDTLPQAEKAEVNVHTGEVISEKSKEIAGAIQKNVVALMDTIIEDKPTHDNEHSPHYVSIESVESRTNKEGTTWYLIKDTEAVGMLTKNPQHALIAKEAGAAGKMCHVKTHMSKTNKVMLDSIEEVKS